jgi:hypothetical protein
VMTAKAKLTTDSASVMAETRKLRVSIGIFIVAAVRIVRIFADSFGWRIVRISLGPALHHRRIPFPPDDAQ